MRTALLACLVVLILPEPVVGDAGKLLTTAQWRADLAQLASAIRETHFKPFHNVSAAEFDAAVAALHDAIPDKRDSEIIVGMAQIVATMRDGHTRLHLPRAYPALALEAEVGHSGTQPPKHRGLQLRQLPLQFEQFADGVFVTGATTEHYDLVGREVVALDKTSIDDALDAVRSVGFFENDSRAKLLAPDRLALPEVLAVLGLVDSADRFRLTTRDSGGRLLQTTIVPLDDGDSPAVTKPTERQPLYLRYRDQDHWYRVLKQRDAIYVQVNRFAENPPAPYSDFVAETLTRARQAGVTRYIIDLRHNSGGLGTWVIPFLTGIASSEFNSYGRLYILMGRTTYSAAQQFLHRFEEFSYAIFVGEPSGGKPSHFSDPLRVLLEHSGLTLRVSTIYWHSWLANDFRDAIEAHIDAPLTSTDYFAGRDPGLDAAIAYEAVGSIAVHAGEQFRQHKNQNGLLLLQRYLTDGRFAHHDRIVPDLHALAQRLGDDALVRPAFFVLWLTDFYFPGNDTTTALLALAQARKDAEAASDP